MPKIQIYDLSNPNENHISDLTDIELKLTKGGDAFAVLGIVAIVAMFLAYSRSYSADSSSADSGSTDYSGA